ncbi:MAG: SRPBCC domain-containing protein [Chloroflexota bacterium]
MTNANQNLEFNRTIAAPVAAVYRAFTHSTILREWLCDAAQAIAKPGGRLYLAWHDGYYAMGEFTELEQDHRVAFTWLGKGEPGPTQIGVSLTAADGHTALALTHSGFGEGETWQSLAAMMRQGWEYGLENLQSILETGHDLRITRRPMMGINLDEFNAEIAAKLGAPVSEGIRLSGALAGMGAAAAGLQKDDVIVGLAGHEVKDWPTLVTALQSRRAGDPVEVVFYRGPEKRTVTMTLSPRPLPTVPATAGELAEALRQEYQRYDEALTQFLAEVSEAEAEYRPAEGEWSTKETLAHLIGGERETHCWIADLINGDERWSDTFSNPTNVPARVQATVRVYGTAAALLAELRRNEQETVAMIAVLPADFVAGKSSYWRLGMNVLQQASHVTDHLEQMRAAVRAARS